MSSTVVTNSAGTKVEELAYEPYGRLRVRTGSVDVRYKYTGQELDDETGLAYYVARYYDPALGRFTQPDTATADHYSYARNNPIVYTDPTGHVATTQVNGGGYSYQHNSAPQQGMDTSLPNPALTMPPAWAVPSGMDLGSMGGGSEFGVSFSVQETRNLGQAGPNEQGGTFTIESFNGMMSGNEAVARFVYSQGQYAGIFTPADVAAMTPNDQGFWHVNVDYKLSGERRDGPIISDTSSMERHWAFVEASMAQFEAQRWADLQERDRQIMARGSCIIGNCGGISSGITPRATSSAFGYGLTITAGRPGVVSGGIFQAQPNNAPNYGLDFFSLGACPSNGSYLQ